VLYSGYVPLNGGPQSKHEFSPLEKSIDQCQKDQISRFDQYTQSTVEVIN
jgi:hypothetical protein